MKRYIPLFVLLAVAALGAWAIAPKQPLHLMTWMRYFMGLLLCQFAMLKLFNLSKFAEGFQMYDVLAKKSRLYAHLYPFIELALGLVYLAGFALISANVLLILLMLFGAFGVVQALRAGLDVRCACMGSVLDVPLSTVTLTEDILMGVMALVMLVL